MVQQSAAADPAATQAADGEALKGDALAPWSAGYLDIHHISTGRGNAAFAILPDGTSVLIDAGALRNDWAERHVPLKLAPNRPDGSRRPGEWIADYIAQFAPPGMTRLDYALITHFHADHFGALRPESPRSARGDWKRVGLTEVAERWPIAMLIDRGYPGYDFPRDLRKAGDASLQNYLRFVDANRLSGAMRVEGVSVGAADQIKLVHAPRAYPGFSIRNIAGNGRIWTGKGSAARPTLDADQITDKKGAFNENPLSIILKLSYGAFDYVTGGDLTGLSEPGGPAWFDMESKVAPVIGPIDAMTLNHHGNRDATNAIYLATLRPRILIEQAWVSDHPGGEVVHRMISKSIWPGLRDIFATSIAPETQVAIGPALTRNYGSTQGHVVIRVQPGGAAYDVFILDDASRARPVIAHFGPYRSR